MKAALGLVAVGCCALGTVNGKVTKWGRDKNEREYRPAQATLGFMPSLLNAPAAPMTTSPPQYGPKDLEKRATTDNTCAYVGGSANFPLYCDATAYCASNSLNSHVGCCPDSAATTCNVWTSCLDSTQRSLFTTDNGFTLWCGFSSYPHCITHIYRDTAGAATALSGYTLLGCAVAAGTDSVYYNPFIFSTSSSSRRTTPTTTPTSSSTATTGRATTTVTQTPTPTPSPASTPVGAIAGGVVGGVAALSLIAFGIWFLMRQNRSKEDDLPSPPGPGAPPPTFPGYNVGPTGGTPATPMSQPGNGYFAPQSEAAAVAGFAAMSQNQRSSIQKPVYTGYDQQQQQYNNLPGGGGGISPSPPASPPLGQQAPPYSASGAQGSPSPPLGSDGRYSYGQVQSGTGSPMDNTGYAAAAVAAGGYQHRESQSTQGGYQAQQDHYSRQQPESATEYGGYAGQDRYQQPPSARESYQPPPSAGYVQQQRESYQQQPPAARDSYQQPPAARESYQQRPEPTYQAYHPGATQAQSGGGYQASQPQPPTNYQPPQPVYQPYPTGGYQNNGYAAELPTVRGDGEVRELQG